MSKKYVNILFTESDLVLLRKTAEDHFTTVSGLIRGVALDYAKRSNASPSTKPTPAYKPAPNPNENEAPAPAAKPMREMTPEEKAEMLRKFGVE